MSQGKASLLTGYIVATVSMTPFFWLTLGDAYGRFMIGFDPAASLVSYYIEPYASHYTGLVCLGAPLILAYFLQSVTAGWIDAVWDASAKAIDWLTVYGKKVSVFMWQQAKEAIRKLKDYRDSKTGV